MKRLIGIVLALLLVAPVSAQSPQIRQLLLKQMPLAGGGGGGCTTSTFAADGSSVAAQSGSATSLTSPSLSTSFCNDLIVVVAGNNATGISTVVDTQGHLTFTRHLTQGGTADYEIWTAPLSGAALSGDTITVTWGGGAAFINMAVIAFSGYKTATPFDPNAAIPNSTTGSGVACTWTTTNANDILIGGTFQNSTTPDAGWSMITNATNSFFFGEYKLVSATQSASTVAGMSTGTGGAVCTAIQQGP